MYDNEEQGPKLSTRKAHQISIELAWRYFFPWLELPSRLFTANWLSVSGNNVNAVLDTIERVSEKMDVSDPAREIWRSLQRVAPARPQRNNDVRRDHRFIVSQVGRA
jgi:hypothetical protein